MKTKNRKYFRSSVGHYKKTKKKFESDQVIIHLNDCNKILKGMGQNSIEAIVTDPPYGIRFLNQHWDYNLPSVKVFKRMFKVMKPGGTLLCFASPATQHRMAINIEDAGFELRDCIMWLFGSGFPKSQNIADLLKKSSKKEDVSNKLVERFKNYRTHALKPAYEPIIMAMKPLDGNYAENAKKHNISGLNIEECRLEDKGKKWEKPRGGIWKTDKDAKAILVDNTVGRFPSNLIYEDSDEVRKSLIDSVDESMNIKDKEFITRIFYCAKVKGKNKNKDNNIHPTIKPIPLMRYLCRLVKSPLGCTILDPFMGSGSTGVACIQENIRFIGIEKEKEYFEIAKNRLTAPKEVEEIGEDKQAEEEKIEVKKDKKPRGRPKGSKNKVNGNIDIPEKRKRGRPKGSKNKVKENISIPEKRKRGRPKGSKNKVKENISIPEKRKRGRPKGSKNKIRKELLETKETKEIKEAENNIFEEKL